MVELTFQKYFFTTSISLGFRVADYFLRVSYTSDAYGKCVLTSEQTFKINQSITRQLQLATWQQKAIFVNFLNFIVGNTQGLELTFEKSFFPALTRLRFWVADYFLCTVYTRDEYKKCFLTSKLTFEIN